MGRRDIQANFDTLEKDSLKQELAGGLGINDAGYIPPNYTQLAEELAQESAAQESCEARSPAAKRIKLEAETLGSKNVMGIPTPLRHSSSGELQSERLAVKTEQKEEAELIADLENLMDED